MNYNWLLLLQLFLNLPAHLGVYTGNGYSVKHRGNTEERHLVESGVMKINCRRCCRSDSSSRRFREMLRLRMSCTWQRSVSRSIDNTRDCECVRRHVSQRACAFSPCRRRTRRGIWTAIRWSPTATAWSKRWRRSARHRTATSCRLPRCLRSPEDSPLWGGVSFTSVCFRFINIKKKQKTSCLEGPKASHRKLYFLCSTWQNVLSTKQEITLGGCLCKKDKIKKKCLPRLRATRCCDQNPSSRRIWSLSGSCWSTTCISQRGTSNPERTSWKKDF